MRVLEVINTGYLAGGAQVNVKLIKDKLVMKKYEVKIFSSDESGDSMFSDFQFRSIRPDSKFKFFQHLFYLPSFFEMRRIVRNFKPDLIHFHTVASFSPSVFFAIGGIPSLMTIHGPEEFTSKLIPWMLDPNYYKDKSYKIKDLSVIGHLHLWYCAYLLRPIYRLGLSGVSLFLAPSRYIAEEIKNDIPAAKIRQLYNGSLLFSGLELPKQKKILYVGRLEKVKGVDYLLRAFKSVIEKIPDAEISIVGDGSSRKDLEALASELKISHRVVFKGWIKDRKKLEKEYQAALCLAIPSVWPENLPTVCIEALSAGRIIIGTKTGGISEMVEDGKTGFLVPTENAPALAGALITLFQMNRKDLELMSEKAKQSALKFDEAQFIDRIEAIYRETAAKLRKT